MLVVSRRPREVVVIKVAGIEIRVTVVRMSANVTRLGFSGPPEAIFLREELLTSDETNNLGSP